MSSPLATLRRGSQVVSFHRAALESSRRFRRPDEAAAFLRAWARDPAAMFVLRRVLREALRSGPLFALSDAQVLDVLGACLADRSISLVADGEPSAASSGAGEGAAAGAGAAASPAAAPAPAPAPKPPAAAAPAAPAPPAVPRAEALAALEDVQIESADVRPEVEEALGELDACQAKVDLASVSLAPMPAKIDPISTSMSQTSAGAVQAIDDL